MIERLPDVKWQHGTFTMPDSLWDIFEMNIAGFIDLTRYRQTV